MRKRSKSSKPAHGVATSTSGRLYAAASSPDYYDKLDALGQRIQPQPDGCWLFDGRADQYGRIQQIDSGPQLPAHRIVYEVLVGPIPEDYHLHHECQVKGCVNPAHLTPMSPSEHMAHHAELRRAS